MHPPLLLPLAAQVPQKQPVTSFPPVSQGGSQGGWKQRLQFHSAWLGAV